MPVYSFASPYFELSLNPAQGRWQVSSASSKLPVLDNLQLRIHYQVGGQRLVSKAAWETEHVPSAEILHGPAQQVRLALQGDAGLRGDITFCLLEAQPLLLWQVHFENKGIKPIIVKHLDMLANARELPGIGKSPAFFSNGWQSWSYTGVYGYQERAKSTRLRPFSGPILHNPGTTRPHKVGVFSSDMFGVLADRHARQGLLAGFLSQRQHFGSLQVVLSPHKTQLNLWANGDNVTLAPGAQLESDWACLQWVELDGFKPLEPYLQAVAREHELDPITGIRLAHRGQSLPQSGWCSWYYYYQKLTAENIRSNLRTIQQQHAALPLELVQIDDGYEAQVGDWDQFSTGFPDGVQVLAQEIKQAGLMPGLWISPFIVHPESQLIQQHPDWLLKGRNGKPANAGWVWDKFCKALDLTHPEALQHAVEQVRRAVHDWGFSFIKLDFLYCAAVSGLYQDPSQSRAQVLRRGLEALRQAAGDETVLLGCGCPLGSAIGLVDAMRIAPDVSPRWLPNILNIPRFFDTETGLPSTRNTIHNALTRANLHRRWWINDPDCLLLREETELSQAEMQTLATVIALTGSQFLLSDDLSALSPERLRIAQALIPVLQNSARILDWFDRATPSQLRLDLSGPAGDWHMLALFNWDDQPCRTKLDVQDFRLQPNRHYLAREFWSGQIIEIDQFVDFDLVAHGTALLAVRPSDPESPAYLGSDLHLSQGLEVVQWQSSQDRLLFVIQRPLHCKGNIFLYIPWQSYAVKVDEQDLKPINEEGYCRLPITCQQGSVSIEIQKT